MLATCRVKQGAPHEGLEIIDSALKAAEQAPLTTQQSAMLHVIQAVPLQLLERHEEAVKAMEKALELLEIQRTYSSGVERERTGVFARCADLYNDTIDALAKSDNVAEMFAVSESMKARAFLDELQTHHVDLLAELPAEQRKTLQAEEARLRRELTAATDAFNALPDFGPKPTDEQLAQQKKAARAVFAARDALYEHLSEVKAASKTYRDLITHQAKTATLADLQKRLDEGELVLSYSVGTDNSYVIAIRNDGAKFTQLVFDEPTAKRFGVESGPATREKLKTALLSEEHGVMPGLSHPKNTPDDFLERLAALWTLLLPEAERDALTGGDVKRLLVLPTDALSLLPFKALVIRTDGELKFLLDVGPPVSYAPSATVLLSLTDREAKAANSETPVLTLGDPAYPQPSEQKDTVDRMMAAFNVSQPFVPHLPACRSPVGRRIGCNSILRTPASRPPC